MMQQDTQDMGQVNCPVLKKGEMQMANAAGAKGLLKEAGRIAAKAVTGDEFKKGIKSTFKSATEATSRSVRGDTLKRAAGRLTDSEYIKTAIKPGLKSAFEQAGGKAGMARRVVGGAAIGGATTGTVGALRGRDFWESSKSGVLMGGMGGLGRQYGQMKETEVGSELYKSVSGEFSKAKAGAERAHSINSGGISSKGDIVRRGGPNKTHKPPLPSVNNKSDWNKLDSGMYVPSKTTDKRGNVSYGGGNAAGTKKKEIILPGQENASSDKKLIIPGQESATSNKKLIIPGQEGRSTGKELIIPGQENRKTGGQLLIPGQESAGSRGPLITTTRKNASPSTTPTRRGTNASRRGKSNQVVTMERAAQHQVLSNKVLGR